MDIKTKLAFFIAEFDLQVDQIKIIYTTLEKKLAIFKSEDISNEMVESSGYWLHNLYCAFEDLFKLVAGFWENNVQTTGSFHIHLLKKMIVNIEGIRPALLTQESYVCLNDLRGFRHVFRHAYNFGLDDERIFHMLRSILKKQDFIFEDLQEFKDSVASVE